MEDADLIQQLTEILEEAHEAGMPRYRIQRVLQQVLDNQVWD